MDDTFEVRVEFVERAGPLRAVDLIAGLETFLDYLAAAEAAAGGDTPGRVTWLVRDLHHSTATIVLAPEDRTAQARAAAQRIHTTSYRMTHGEAVDLTEGECRVVRELLGIGSRMELVMSVPGETGQVGLVESAAASERQPLTPPTESWGTVEGSLESLTVHQRRECSIWNDTTGKRIPVSFEEGMLERVAALFGRKVRATGRLHYRGTEIVRLEIETIEEADEVSMVPLDSLFGRGRTWFGDAPSGELTRSLWARDE